MSTRCWGRWVLMLGLVAGSAGALRAEPPRDEFETATLIEQLGSGDIPTQFRAIDTLEDRELETGDIPLLKKAADMDNVLGSHAAIKLLAPSAQGETAIAPAAREALKELSASTKPHLAAGAAQALRVVDAVVDPAIPGNPSHQKGVFESVQSRTINGQRKITAKTPDRSIDIQDQDGKQIEITVTETAGGKPTTYTANDVDDLKQKHPDIAALYEKYTKPGLGLPPGFGAPPRFGVPPQIGGPPGFGPPPGFGGPRPGADAAQSGPAREAYDQIEMCLTRLAKVTTALKKMKKETFDQDQLNDLLDELDAAKKELFAAQTQLGVR